MNSRADNASQSRPARPRLWTPTFLAILALTLFSFIVGQGLNAGTSVYITRMGGTTAFAGILAADFSLSAGVMRIACGNVIDTRGRMLVVRIGGVLLLIGTLGPLLVASDPALVFWRFLQGIGFAAATTAAATAAADVLPVERLGEGIGYYGLGQAIAMSVGPALALALVATEPATNLFLGLAVSAALSLGIALFCRYEKNPRTLPETSAYRVSHEQAGATRQAGADAVERPRGIAAVFERRALPGAIPMMVMCPTFGFGIFFVGLLGTELGIANSGLFYTVSAVSMIAVRLKSSALIDRTPAIKLFTVAVICGILAYLLLFGVAQGVFRPDTLMWAFYAAGIPYGICLGLALPLNQSVAVKNTPPERWGACNALFLLTNDIGIGGAAGIWGALNDALGFSASITGVLICLVASYVVAWACYPAREKRWRG